MRNWFACALMLAMSVARSAGAEGNDARIVTSDAGAMTRHNRLMPWHPLAGGKVPEIAQLRCEKRCEILADADVRIELEPGAIIALRDHFFIPLVPVPPMTRARQVELVEGRMTVYSAERQGAEPIVVEHEGAFFAVRSGKAQLATRGSELLVSVIGAKGRVAVHRTWSTIEADQSIVLGPQGKSSPHPNLAVPEWDFQDPTCAQPINLASEGKATIGACWKPVANAASYEIEVAKDGGFAEARVEQRTSPSWSVEREPGRCFVRVRAVDSEGFRTAPAPPRACGVIPIRLAPGAIFQSARRVLVTPEGAPIEFREIKDLEIAFDNAGYHPLTQVVGVEGVAQHQVTMRYLGDTNPGSVFAFERRQLHAEIRIAPRIAHWPQDPLEIAVTLDDPAGHWDPQNLRPNLEVLIGMMQTNLEWAKHGATWTARLPPRDLGKPTVVRVIAKDEFGQQLGRNFLEVDYTPKRDTVPTTPRAY